MALAKPSGTNLCLCVCWLAGVDISEAVIAK